MVEKISAMAIVITKRKKVLLLNSEGEWVFPKGHVEASESLVDAAIREIKEESDIDISSSECLGQVDEFKFYFDGEKAVKVIKVLAFLIDRQRPITYKEEECFIDGKWVSVSDAFEMLAHDDAKAALRKAIAKI